MEIQQLHILYRLWGTKQGKNKKKVTELRKVLVLLLVLLCISTIASQGIEVQNITVEGHYGFGTASSDIAMLTLFVEQGNTEFKHHSASLTATVKLAE